MNDPRELAHALEARGVSDWFVVHRTQQLASLDERAPATTRTQTRTRWHVTVHDDSTRGRGSAQLAFESVRDDADAVVDLALVAARTSVGAAWTSTPPAAPAQVQLLDDARQATDLLALARDIAHAMPRPSDASVTTHTRVMQEQVTALGRGGFHASWAAMLLVTDATLARAGRSLELAREARRPRDLELDTAYRDAAADLALLDDAGAPTAGPCSVLLGTDAMLHAGLGVWQAFALQADAAVEREGLTRYRERTMICEGAAHIAEPLSIASDGALDFATRSAPLGDDGDAVRRFALIERGIAVGLGLSPKEAALRGRDPNGGVRNLVVAPGSWSGAIDDLDRGARIIEVRRARGLAIDRYTGEARLDIALGLEHGGGGSPRPFTGGTVSVDLIAGLAVARRCATRVRRGAYDGPTSVWLPAAVLVA